MNEPDLYRLRECSLLGERAAVDGMEHASFAYHHWARRHVEELLYEDLWRATAPIDRPKSATAATAINQANQDAVRAGRPATDRRARTPRSRSK